ncbi:MAG: TonB-dependent receptor [Proteobacteria bacterium]|nr:TonB-dependent receptor [Pseudomonadota bacterium]
MRPLAAAIPAQPLDRALTELAEQTGLQLVYVSGVVQHRRSHAVPAGLEPEAALLRLLEGTGLVTQHLTGHSVRIVRAEVAAPGNGPENPEAPREVVVTATRREESIQEVPLTVLTLSGEQLQQLGVSTFDGLLHYTPNVTFSGNGPGTGNIFIRGLGFVGTGNQAQSTIAPFPNVALTLDDQPMQFPARNNDVYMVDLARVEILEGPQGTLFGGGAQAGAIRYITNRPQLDNFSGEATAGWGTTSGGDPNSMLTATFNVPLVAGTLAARAVVFSEQQGGYINNVPGTSSFVPGSIEASTGVTASNVALVGTDTNPVQFQGARLSLLWQVADQWKLLVQQNYQGMTADGYFYAYPVSSDGRALAPYEITAFEPAYTHDRYESTALTLEGHVKDLDLVYTGSYLVRNIEGQQDYSGYMRSQFGRYYACIGTGAGFFNSGNFPAPPPAGLSGTPLRCYPPVAFWHDTTRNTHQSHELRLSTDRERRLRGIAGAFWESFVISDQMDWHYLSIPQCGAAGSATLTAALGGGPPCLSAVGPFAGLYAAEPGTHPDAAFGTDTQRGYRQLAFFGSVDFDLVPKVLTVTAGLRHYRYDKFEDGSLFYSDTLNPLILNHPDGSCGTGCAIPITLSGSESGTVTRGSLNWHVAPDVNAYYTYSQGFRPASFNRSLSYPGQPPVLLGAASYCGAASTDPRCLPGGSLYQKDSSQYAISPIYQSDRLINNEVGLKSEFFEHRLSVDASAYLMRWSNVQWPLADFTNLSTLSFVANGPSYRTTGVELQVRARLSPAWTFEGSGTWNRSAQVNAPCMKSVGRTAATPNNPTPAGQCITVIHGLPYTNPWGPEGSSLPFAPPVQFSTRLRWERPTGSLRPFAYVSASHIAAMRNAPENYPDGDGPGENPPTAGVLKYTISGYTTYNGGVGLAADRWSVQLNGSNLTDVYGPAGVSSAQFIKAVIPLRPRVLMFGFSERF